MNRHHLIILLVFIITLIVFIIWMLLSHLSDLINTDIIQHKIILEESTNNYNNNILDKITNEKYKQKILASLENNIPIYGYVYSIDRKPLSNIVVNLTLHNNIESTEITNDSGFFFFLLEGNNLQLNKCILHINDPDYIPIELSEVLISSPNILILIKNNKCNVCLYDSNTDAPIQPVNKGYIKLHSNSYKNYMNNTIYLTDCNEIAIESLPNITSIEINMIGYNILRDYLFQFNNNNNLKYYLRPKDHMYNLIFNSPLKKCTGSEVELFCSRSRRATAVESVNSMRIA